MNSHVILYLLDKYDISTIGDALIKHGIQDSDYDYMFDE